MEDTTFNSQILPTTPAPGRGFDIKDGGDPGKDSGALGHGEYFITLLIPKSNCSHGRDRGRLGDVEYVFR